ncbi:MAG TPA: 16S rRNA (adenine(1518)-N(6)/adenine(1519)-N(6))-dimethyltransferase RsmA [Candidatus Saccharimonadales bacterium]|jgi:16S rRNA (adenine1518-N6/adenine1519-N6)-dimethyltransferase|nr:16S rRNA (adenine(1518)-N(6)/adenine(1519)-N(6))-dimethyltransferase RsmA [Candidatus Saccharimonadales bacterium]
MNKIMGGGKMTGFEPKKSLGQHWLNDSKILSKIVSYANLSKQDYVLEVGPGLGSLTSMISSQAGKVLAVEIDETLFKHLKLLNLDQNLEIINQDILKFDLTQLPKDYKIVANIPYYLTSHLIRLLTESTNPPIKIVLLIQKEVAERIAAKPGSMSILSVVVQQYFNVELQDVVAAEMFTPPPKVDSRIVVLTRRSKPQVSTDNDKDFFRLVKVGFSARRKTLENSISNGLREDKQSIKRIINEAKLKPNIRPQMLSINQWGKLFKLFKAHNLL